MYVILVDARAINQGISLIYDDEDYHSAKIFDSTEEIYQLAGEHALLKACPYTIINISDSSNELDWEQ